MVQEQRKEIKLKIRIGRRIVWLSNGFFFLNNLFQVWEPMQLTRLSINASMADRTSTVKGSVNC